VIAETLTTVNKIILGNGHLAFILGEMQSLVISEEKTITDISCPKEKK
jgi:hypothetical protein